MTIKFISAFIGVCLLMTNTQQSFAHKQAPISTAIVNPDTLFDPAPYGFSHAVVVNGAKKMVYIAGQGGEDTHGNLQNNFEAQVRQAYKNILTVLESTNAKPHQVLKLTTYVVDYDQSKLSIMTKELKALFGNHLPAQTLVPVPRLALDGMLFEVDAIAALDK